MGETKMKFIAFCLMTASLLSACGHKDDPAPVVAPVVTQSNAVVEECDRRTSEDYRNLNRSCRPPRNRDAGRWCKGFAEKLLPQISEQGCTVKMRERRESEERDHLVTAQEIRELLERMHSARF